MEGRCRQCPAPGGFLVKFRKLARAKTASRFHTLSMSTCQSVKLLTWFVLHAEGTRCCKNKNLYPSTELRGSKYPILEVSDPQNHTPHGIWDQSPQIHRLLGPSENATPKAQQPTRKRHLNPTSMHYTHKKRTWRIGPWF